MVTAVSTRGFWIQSQPWRTEYLGIYVYAGTGVTLPAEGHEVVLAVVSEIITVKFS